MGSFTAGTVTWALLAVAGYVLGWANGAILVSKIFYHDDVRSHGSGNAGLTNFYRTYGAKLVLCVIAVDMLKAVVVVELGGAFLGGALGKYFMGFFCMLGHMFPAPYRFKGGKGILSSGTLLLCLDWRVALVSWGAFVVLVALTRYVSLGSVAAAALLPVTTFFVYRGAAHFPWIMLLGTLIGGMVVWAHRENIKRLIRGTESKFTFHKGAENA